MTIWDNMRLFYKLNIRKTWMDSTGWEAAWYSRYKWFLWLTGLPALPIIWSTSVTGQSTYLPSLPSKNSVPLTTTKWQGLVKRRRKKGERDEEMKGGRYTKEGNMILNTKIRPKYCWKRHQDKNAKEGLLINI